MVAIPSYSGSDMYINIRQKIKACVLLHLRFKRASNVPFLISRSKRLVFDA